MIVKFNINFMLGIKRPLLSTFGNKFSLLLFLFSLVVFIQLGRSQTTYYSYQNGDWKDDDTWTTDPSGTLSINKAVPATGDFVVLLNGRTVTVSDNDIVVDLVDIQDGAILNLGETTGHNFATLAGQGILRLTSTVLPNGNRAAFVAPNGGTIEYCGASSFSFNTDNTFNNLIINLSATDLEATINTNFSVNGNLQIRRGTLIIGDGTTRNVNVEGNTTVDANGRINVAPFNQRHNLYLRGDLTINGAVTFTNRTEPNFLADGGWRVHVIFDNAFADQHVTINADAIFYRIGINKGTDDTYILHLEASNNTFFKLYGPNNTQTNSPGTPPNIVNNNALGLEAGTLRLGANIIVPALASSVNYNYTTGGQGRNYAIDEDATLWIDGATVYTTHFKAPSNNIKSIMSVYGKLKISSGSLIDEAAQGIGLRTTGQMIVEGGSVEATVIRTSAESTNHRGAFIQSGGTVTIRRDIVTFDGFSASFHLGFSTTSFIMTGGEMNILASTPTTSTYNNGKQFSLVVSSSPQNIDVSGGSINISVPDDRNAYYATSTPFHNLRVLANSFTNEFRPQNYPTGEIFEAKTAGALVVTNDFSLNSPAHFNANNLNVTVGHDFSIEAGSTYTPGTNTTIFNGSAGQFLNNAGTITSGLNNMTVSNSSILSISNNLSLRGNLGIDDGVILRDMGRTIKVEGNIINSGSHFSQSGGAIVLSGSGNQTIGGNGNGVFGNLWLDKVSGNTTLIANSTVNGNIRLANTSAVLNIGSYNLALSSTSNVYDDLTGNGTNFSSTRMVQTNGLQSDGGVTIQFVNTSSRLYPIGVSGKYTRATLVFESAPTQWGRATIRPVNNAHPLATSEDALDYFWKVTSQGFDGIPANSIRLRLYYDLSDINGNINDYVPGVFNPSSWSTFSVDKVSPAIQEILFDNIASVDGDFTAGQLDAFGPILTFYSRDGGGNWDTPATWSNDPSGEPAASSTPTAGSPVVIRNGHTVTVSDNGRIAGSLRIENGGVLDLGTFTSHNFGAIEDEKVTGNGTLRISSAVATAQFPNGDFGEFLGENGGTVEYYTTETVNFTIPVNNASGNPIQSYYNLILNSGAGRIVTMPNVDLNILGSLSSIGVGTARFNSAAARTLTISENIDVDAGILEFNNNNAQTVIVYGNINVLAGATFRVSDSNTAVNNALYLYGNLVNDGTFNLAINPENARRTDAFFTSTNNQTISGSGEITSFYRLYVNKGVDQSSVLYVNSANFTLRTGLTPAPLYIQNGTIRFTNPSLTATLSAANALNVPSTGRLVVDGSTVIVGSSANNAGDLLLSGRLEVHSGTLNIGTDGNNNHNDIEYAAAGSPEIYISGGTLNVNGQIRRSTSISTGALSYTQSGGEVNIRGRNRQVTRALLEVLNPGSVFNMSGGSINLINGGGTTFGDIYLEAEESSVAGGTISIGSGATATIAFNLYFANSIWNLTIDGISNAKTATLRTFPLTLGGNITINGPFASTLNTSELPVSIGGSLINNSIAANAYQTTGNQLTRFTGSSNGGIVSNGAGSLVFQNLDIDKDLISSVITKSGASGVTINRDLTITNGTLNTQTDILLNRNVYNFARHSSSGGKLIFESPTAQQHMFGDDNAEFGGIDINNPLGVVSSISFSISGELSFTDGFLDIGDRNLVFKSSGATTNFSDSKYIISNGALSDAGITKEYGVGGEDFTFPIGVAGKYTPSTFNVTSTGGVAGSITVKPINSYHPAVQTGYGNDELQFYWNVTSTGFNNPTLTHSYTYLPADIEGVEADYVSGRYLNFQWLDDIADNSGTVDPDSHSITHTNVNYVDGEYTAGVAANFVSKPILYSITSGDWYNGNTWSTTSGGAPFGGYPDGNPVIIENNHTVTVTTNGAYAYSMDIQLGSTLDIMDTREHNFGHVKGGGTIKIAATDKGSFIFPGGFYDELMNTAESTIEYSGTGTLPSSITSYQNITFTGEGSFKYIPSIDILVRGNLLIGEGYLDNTNYNRNITILGNWTSNVMGGFMAGRGMVTFAGSSSTISSVGGETFYNLRINRAGGMLTLNSPANVSRYLYLTRGFVFTDNLNILTLTWNSINAVIGGSSLSFVDGPLSKNISTGSSFFFPVGNGGRYGRIRVFGTSTSGYWIAQYHNQTPANRDDVSSPLQLVSTNEYWTISGPNSSTANVLLRWDTQSDIIPPTSLGRQKLRVAQYISDNWVGVGNRVSDGGVNSGTVQTTTPTSTHGVQIFTLGLDETATAIITGVDGEMCDDGSTLPVNVAFTGEGPWSLTYTINGANHTTLNSIGTSPYPILFDYSELFNISGANSYLIELASVYDRFGEQGVTLASSATLTLKVTPNPVISGNDRVMISTQEVYSVQEVADESYSWSVSLGTIVGSSTNRSVTIDWSGSPGNGWVEVTVLNTTTGCSRTERYDVVIRDWPVISGNFNPFASSEEVYSTPFYPGHTYLWEVVGGTIKDGIDDQNIVTILWGKEAAGTITVTQTDTESFFDTDSRLVTLTPTAQPLANDDFAVTEYITPVTIDVLANDQNLNDIPLLVTIVSSPAQGSAIVNGDNTITYTPPIGFDGLITFVYRVADVHDDWDEATVHVTVLPEGVTNHIPVANDDYAATEFETAVNINVLVNDTGLEDVLINLTITTPPALGSVILEADNTITFTPALGFDGLMTFVYRVTDTHGEFDEATVYVTVLPEGVTNHIPVANDDYAATEFEAAVNINVLANDTGLEDVPITLSISTPPALGSVLIEANNTVTFAPAAGFDGLMTFTYRVTDTHGEFDEATVHVTVLPEGVTNHIPEAKDDYVATEFETAVNINVLVNDTGLEDTPIVVTIVSSPAQGLATVEANNTITFTPAMAFDGLMTFTYRVTDTHGEFDEATVHVTVLPEGASNAIPVANDVSVGTSFNTPRVIDVLANDTGLDDEPVVVTIYAEPNPAEGSAVVNADNTIDFTPATDYVGVAIFRYLVTDADGDADHAEVKVTVKEGENFVPIAMDDSRGTSFNTPVDIEVLENDLNLQDEPITVTISVQSSAIYGTATVNADNSVTFTPATDYLGVATFIYRVADVDDDYDEATVTISVKEGENAVPVAVSDIAYTHMDMPVEVDVLANDSKLDDSPIKVFIQTAAIDHGEVEVLENNQVRITPEQGFVGELKFIYRVVDVDGDFDEAEVTVVVYSAIIALDDEAEVMRNESVVIDVLANDEGLQHITPELTVSQAALHGMVTVNTDNTLTYTPDLGYFGDDSFTYRVWSQYGACDEANVNINVKIESFRIPEGFSPDGDGINDTFEIIGLEAYRQVKIRIYNRWGHIVYQNNNYKNNWDGKASAAMSVGRTLPTGTYYYIIEIVDTNEKFTGNIFLKR